jgi:hypothetical protein
MMLVVSLVLIFMLEAWSLGVVWHVEILWHVEI